MSDRIITEWAIEVGDDEDFSTSYYIGISESKAMVTERLAAIVEIGLTDQYVRLVSRTVQVGSWETVGG